MPTSTRLSLREAESTPAPNVCRSTHTEMPIVSLAVALGTDVSDLIVHLRETELAALHTHGVVELMHIAECRSREALARIPGLTQATSVRIESLLTYVGLRFNTWYTPDLRRVLELSTLDRTRYEILRSLARLQEQMPTNRRRRAYHQLKINLQDALLCGLDDKRLWPGALPQEQAYYLNAKRFREQHLPG